MKTTSRCAASRIARRRRADRRRRRRRCPRLRRRGKANVSHGLSQHVTETPSTASEGVTADESRLSRSPRRWGRVRTDSFHFVSTLPSLVRNVPPCSLTFDQLFMLIVHPWSTCDVCLDPFSWATVANAPHAISCGHIFCLQCVPRHLLLRTTLISLRQVSSIRTTKPLSSLPKGVFPRPH